MGFRPQMGTAHTTPVFYTKGEIQAWDLGTEEAKEAGEVKEEEEAHVQAMGSRSYIAAWTR